MAHSCFGCHWFEDVPYVPGSRVHVSPPEGGDMVCHFPFWHPTEDSPPMLPKGCSNWAPRLEHTHDTQTI